MTTVTVFPQAFAPGAIELQLVQGGAVRDFYVVPGDTPTQLQFPSGIVIAPGEPLSIINRPASIGSIKVLVHGYEAADL